MENLKDELDAIINASPDTGRLTALAKEFAKQRALESELSEKLKNQSAIVDRVKADLAAEMTANGMKSFTTDEQRITRSEFTHYSVSAEDKDRLIAWLDQNQSGEIARRTVNPRTMDAFMRDRVESEQEIPEFVKQYTETRISQTKL